MDPRGSRWGEPCVAPVISGRADRAPFDQAILPAPWPPPGHRPPEHRRPLARDRLGLRAPSAPYAADVTDNGEHPAYRADDPAYRAALTDLLGVLAHGSLMSCLRMAADADLAPTLSLKASMARLASAEYRHFEDLVTHVRGLGLDPDTAMQPFVAPFAAYHERTRPSTWLEALVKAYVGEGIAKDFFREMADFVDPSTRAALEPVLDERDEAEFVVPIVRAALATDPSASGRLALWGRRLMGEAMSQAQAVAVDRDALANLLVGSGADLTQVGEMFARLQRRHQERMLRLGLDA